MLRLSLLLLLWLGGGLWERKAVAQTRKKHVLSTTSAPRKPAFSSQQAAKGVVAAPPVVLPSWKMPYELVNLSELRRNAAEWERLSRSSLEFNLLYEQGKPPQLLCRYQPADTVWLKVRLNLPVYAVGDTLNKLTWEDAMALPDTCNLDRRGAAEVRVTVIKETHGWGSGAITSNWTCFNIIAIDQEPHLLLAGLIERWDASWQTGDLAVPGGRKQLEHYLKQGWHRKVLFSPILRLGKATRYRADVAYEPSTLTRLRPGRYRYLSGNLVWVGQ